MECIWRINITRSITLWGRLFYLSSISIFWKDQIIENPTDRGILVETITQSGASEILPRHTYHHRSNKAFPLHGRFSSKDNGAIMLPITTEQEWKWQQLPDCYDRSILILQWRSRLCMWIIPVLMPGLLFEWTIQKILFGVCLTKLSI